MAEPSAGGVARPPEPSTHSLISHAYCGAEPLHVGLVYVSGLKCTTNLCWLAGQVSARSSVGSKHSARNQGG